MKNIFKNWFGATCEVVKATESNNRIKQCAECKVVKTAADFHKNNKNKDGLQSMCKQCRRVEYAKWYAAEKKGQKSTKRKTKRPSFLRKTTLQRSHSNYNIKKVPVELKIALHNLAKERKTTMEKLGHQMIKDFLTLNSK